MQAGIYRHNKGGLYQVLGLAHDANFADRTLVVYIPLELDPSHLGPRLAVRNLDNFLGEHMHLRPTGNWNACHGACHEAGSHVPRFVYQGPELTAEILNGRAQYMAAVAAWLKEAADADR